MPEARFMLSAFLARDQRVSMFKSEPLWPSLVRGSSSVMFSNTSTRLFSTRGEDFLHHAVALGEWSGIAAL